MQILSAPIHAPGCCCVCRTTPPGPYVDLGQFVDRERLYLCPGCVAELDRVRGVDKRDADEIALADAEAALEALADDHESDDELTCRYCGRPCKNAGGLNSHERTCSKRSDAA